MSNVKHFFVVETMEVIDGHKLGKLQKDNDGYYVGVPLMCLGIPTQINTTYNVEPTVRAITDPQSRFNIMLKAGSLYGEQDHPPARTKEDIPRMLDIMKKFESHHFKKIYTDTKPLANGGILVLGDLKPTGPYGPYLKESLENRCENTSFSVRSLCNETVDNQGNRIRDIQILITFDSVSAGGFKEASKRFSPGAECFQVYPEDFPVMKTEAGLESSIISDREFASVFGSKHIQINRTIIPITGSYIPGSQTFIDSDGRKHSLCHSLFRR